jgi:hypothetical protein
MEDYNFNYNTAGLASIELVPFSISMLCFICLVGGCVATSGNNGTSLGARALVFCCSILIFIITYYTITYTGYHPYMIIPLTLCVCLFIILSSNKYLVSTNSTSTQSKNKQIN